MLFAGSGGICGCDTRNKSNRQLCMLCFEEDGEESRQSPPHTSVRRVRRTAHGRPCDGIAEAFLRSRPRAASPACVRGCSRLCVAAPCRVAAARACVRARAHHFSHACPHARAHPRARACASSSVRGLRTCVRAYAHSALTRRRGCACEAWRGRGRWGVWKGAHQLHEHDALVGASRDDALVRDPAHAVNVETGGGAARRWKGWGWGRGGGC
eukprot:6176843-Pleurochrysis_carterae.AAC.2